MKRLLCWTTRLWKTVWKTIKHKPLLPSPSIYIYIYIYKSSHFIFIKAVSSCCSCNLISWFCRVSSSTLAVSVWICRTNVAKSWRVLGSIWTCKLNGTTVSNLGTKISFSRMVPNWWSKNRQSSRLVQMSRQPRPCTWKCRTKSSLGGHWCGAC